MPFKGEWQREQEVPMAKGADREFPHETQRRASRSLSDWQRGQGAYCFPHEGQNLESFEYFLVQLAQNTVRTPLRAAAEPEATGVWVPGKGVVTGCMKPAPPPVDPTPR